MDHLAFIVRIKAHIPDKGPVTASYCALYRSARGGDPLTDPASGL
jgi:hypothetical protein